MNNIEVIEVDWSHYHKLLSAIRRDVFIVEQNVPEALEWDGIDEKCRHVLAMEMSATTLNGSLNEDSHNPANVSLSNPSQQISKVSRRQAIGLGRLVPDGSSVQIGRMAIVKDCRRQGVGHRILQKLIELAIRDGHTDAYLHAQLYVTEFYRQAGFESVGETFMDAGIPHVKMIRQF